MYVEKLEEVTTVTGLDPKKPVRLYTTDANGDEIYLGRHENLATLRVCQEVLITQSEFELRQKKAELEAQIKVLENK